MTEQFWDSWPGRQVRWRQRWLRTRRFRLAGEPRQKKSCGERQHVMATQRSLLEELKLFHHNALTGPVALDLNFHVTTDQPPALYNLAKYLLDVLRPTHFEGQGRERRHVLYRDDRQVKLLYVHLSHPSISDATVKTVDDGHTWLTARPLRDVLEDIRLVDELEAATDGFSRWDDDDDCSPFHRPDIPDVDLSSMFDLDQATSDEEAQRWADLNRWFTLHEQSQLQETLLRNTDAQVACALRQSPESIAGARPQRRPLAENAAFRSIYEDLDELHAQNRHTLLTNPINIPMPSLPRISGERKSFKANIRRELEQWRARWPIFQPLLVPLKMTFLVIPSEQGGKDLDNLALEVLPLVHEVLRPQPTSWLLRFPLLTAEDRMEDNRARSRLRFLGVNSVTAFEVIELQRRASDPSAGVLRLVLGSGSQIGSTWTRITNYAEHHMERISD